MNKAKTTFVTTTANHIGQVSLDQANTEITRLKNQTGQNWIADESDYLYVTDEIEEDVLNPCPLSDGFVWIVVKD